MLERSIAVLVHNSSSLVQNLPMSFTAHVPKPLLFTPKIKVTTNPDAITKMNISSAYPSVNIGYNIPYTVGAIMSVQMPWHTHDQPLRITNPKARKIPKGYICCTEFGNIQFKAQKSPADWDYHELMKGHDVMITAPEELVRLLETEGI